MAYCKKAFDLNCDVISETEINFCRKMGKLMPGAIKYLFRSGISPVSWQTDSGGGGIAPPPASAGNVRKYSVVGRVNRLRVKATS